MALLLFAILSLPRYDVDDVLFIFHVFSLSFFFYNYKSISALDRPINVFFFLFFFLLETARYRGKHDTFNFHLFNRNSFFFFFYNFPTE